MSYDKYYQTENLFGEAYPELIHFFKGLPERGEVLDLGCGQGRDAIALARLGFSVTGMDNSAVGIEQMNQIAEKENLSLAGLVEDLYAYDHFDQFDVILLDSMFHFGKKEKAKETGLIRKITSRMKSGSLLVVCIQDSGKKVDILNQTIDESGRLSRIKEQPFLYTFEDRESGHRSESEYQMIVARCS